PPFLCLVLALSLYHHDVMMSIGKCENRKPSTCGGRKSCAGRKRLYQGISPIRHACPGQNAAKSHIGDPAANFAVGDSRRLAILPLDFEPIRVPYDSPHDPVKRT